MTAVETAELPARTAGVAVDSRLPAYLGEGRSVETLEEVLLRNLVLPEGWRENSLQVMHFARRDRDPSSMEHIVATTLRFAVAAYALGEARAWHEAVTIISRANLGTWPTPWDFPLGLLVHYSALSLTIGDMGETRAVARRIDESESGVPADCRLAEERELLALLALTRCHPGRVEHVVRLRRAAQQRVPGTFDTKRCMALGALMDAVAWLDEDRLGEAAIEIDMVHRENFEREIACFRLGRPSEFPGSCLLDLTTAGVLALARGFGLKPPMSPFFDLDWISRASVLPREHRSTSSPQWVDSAHIPLQ